MGESSKERLRSYWRPIVIVAAALVLGVIAGGLVEHQRAENNSDAGPVPASTQPATPDAWFDSNAAAACPAAEKWYGALGSAVYLVLGNKPWEPTRSGVVSSWAVMADQYQALLPLANPAGKAELQFMATSLDQLKPVIAVSPSAQAFLHSPNPSSTAKRLGNDFTILLQSVKACNS